MPLEIIPKWTLFSLTFQKRLIQLIITLLSTPWINWELVFLFYHEFAHTWWIDGNMLSCSISHQVNLRFLLAFRKVDIYRHYYLIFLLIQYLAMSRRSVYFFLLMMLSCFPGYLSVLIATSFNYHSIIVLTGVRLLALL